jgi:Tfp pilus assembly protein PilX
MKTISSRYPRAKRGMALISVLAVLLLLTLLVVAFLARTTSARTASASYHATANTRLLADTAVNLVQAQINEATTVGLSTTGSFTLYDTWGSQPGAIRVYQNNTTTNFLGSLAYVYRLYSATPTQVATNMPRMINVSGSVDPAATTLAYSYLNADLPTNANWSTYTAQWCDLNASTQDSQGRYHFPIIDPRDPAADPTANPTSVAPIWNTSALQAANSSGNASQIASAQATTMKGFSIRPPATITNPATPITPAPMPVRWLYVLKDGSIIAPDSPATASNVLAFTHAVNSAGAADIPSPTNPIVGRIAYWTDDDSSKINVNTAAGDDVVRGTNQYAADSIYWTTPTFCGQDDIFMAQYQPIEGEIQRYAGHPGTVGLNSILSTLAGLATPLSYTDFYSLLPRYTAGGSQSSTVYVPYNGGAAPYVPLTANRLYTSIGEMLFKADRSHSALVTDTTSEAAAAAAVERANFFLTAHSSSSELNLFGEPKICIWPITTARAWASAAQSETPVDQLIAFDSTVARTTTGTPDLFYFQRTDPTSSVTDCTIPNNILLFKYLDTLTNTKIPGFGYAFTQKYPSAAPSPVATSSRQIISEIFDYIRTVNMNDPILLAETPNQTPSYGYGQNWGLNYASPVHGGISAGQGIGNLWGGGYRGGAGTFQVVPSANHPNGAATFGVNGWGTQGLGAFPLPVEVAVHFVSLGLGYQPAVKNPATGDIVRAAQPEWPVPYQQYKDPNVASLTTTLNTTTPNTFEDETSTTGNPVVGPGASFEYMTETNTSWTNPPGAPPDVGITSPAGGRPPDWSTAMEAFVYVSFINPGQVTSRSQPMFCYSVTGLNQFSVTDPVSGKTIPLHFPGNSAATAAGSSTDEEKVVVDNSDGGGFINGWIGDWIFGYIPWMGGVGDNNYGGNPGMLSPQQGVQTTWGIANSIPVAGGGAVSGRAFPLYSQIFSIAGQQVFTNTLTPTPYPQGFTVSSPAQDKGTYSTGNKNALGTFTFTTAPITIKMYDAAYDGQSLSSPGCNLVSTYTVSFPASTKPATIPLPTYAVPYVVNAAPPYWQYEYHCIGTTGDGGPDRWHYGLDSISPAWSDARDLAMNSNNGAATFVKHPNYGQTSPLTGMAHDLMCDSVEPFIGNYNPTNWGRLVTQAIGGAVSYYPAIDTNPMASSGINYPLVPPILDGAAGLALPGTGAFTTTGVPGDWDNGTAWYPDGPWDNFPDEGALTTNVQYDDATAQFDEGASIAYYATGNLAQKSAVVSTFSPNRMMPSPVMFGSLPTGILPSYKVALPWQTLLFRPGDFAGGIGAYHPGERNQPAQGDPADELLLDLFWMPQVEPYPISQPFVTEGKINLNYEIQPFVYITRDTALRALMAGEKVAVMPDGVASTYKGGSFAPPNLNSTSVSAITTPYDPNGNQRLPIDPDQTLGLNPDYKADPHTVTAGSSTTFPGQTAQTSAGIGADNAWYDYQTVTGNGLPGQTRFFRSPAELCDMFLVPQTYDWQSFSGFTLNTHSWFSISGNNNDFALVGDNNRERPYADLYSRVTTKSNTYTVFYTVQTLKNAEPQVTSAGTTPGQQIWDESKGAITGQFRGSTIVERYIDPNEKLPDCLANTAGGAVSSLEPYYKWRVVEAQEFAP